MYSQVTTGKFGSGFIGGSVGEVFAPITSELFKSNSLSQGMTKLATSSIMFASGGDVGDIHMAGNVGESVFVNNNAIHALRNIAVGLFAITTEEALVLSGGMVATGVVGQTVNNMDSEPSVPSILSTPMPEIQKPKVIGRPIAETMPPLPALLITDQPSWSILSTPEQTYQPWQQLPGYVPETGRGYECVV